MVDQQSSWFRQKLEKLDEFAAIAQQTLIAHGEVLKTIAKDVDLNRDTGYSEREKISLLEARVDRLERWRDKQEAIQTRIIWTLATTLLGVAVSIVSAFIGFN